jgi:hypothetical protein
VFIANGVQMASKLRQRKGQTAGGMAVQRHRAEARALDGCGRAAGVYVAALLVVAIIFVAKIKSRNRMRNSLQKPVNV